MATTNQGITTERMAELERAFSFTPFYDSFLELRNEIRRLRGEGVSAGVEPLCPDSPDRQHHATPIGSGEEWLPSRAPCYYCGVAQPVEMVEAVTHG